MGNKPRLPPAPLLYISAYQTSFFFWKVHKPYFVTLQIYIKLVSPDSWDYASRNLKDKCVILISLLLYRELNDSKVVVLIHWKWGRVGMDKNQQLNFAIMLMENQARELMSARSVTNMVSIKSPKKSKSYLSLTFSLFFSFFLIQCHSMSIPYTISSNKSWESSYPCSLKPVLSKPVDKFW